MYPDERRIKNNRVIVRFDDFEYELLVSLAAYRGDQLATMLREIIMNDAGGIFDAKNKKSCAIETEVKPRGLSES